MKHTLTFTFSKPGDLDNDGWLDLIKTNFAGDYPNVYRNTGDGIFEDVVVRAGLAVNPQYVGWGVAFADFDNDALHSAIPILHQKFLQAAIVSVVVASLSATVFAQSPEA